MVSTFINTGAFLTIGIFLCAVLVCAGVKSIRLVQDVVSPGGQTLKMGGYAVVVNEKVNKVEFLQNSKVVATREFKCTKQQKKTKETQGQLEQVPGRRRGIAHGRKTWRAD